MSEAAQKRNLILVLAAMLANVYLMAFALDAGLSILDEIVQGLTGSLVLSATRTAIALGVAVASLVMTMLVVLVPQLPKRAFVPLILFAIWAAFGAPPLDLSNAGFLQLFILVLAQLGLAGLAFVLIHAQTGSCWLAAERLPVKSHLVLRIGISVIAVGVAAFLVAPVLIVGSLVAMVEQDTAGYVRLTGDGVEVADRTFRKGDQTVRLVGMVHIGEAGFYSDLYDGFPKGALVLAEGATDKNKVLEGNLSYKRVAQLLGLDQQPALRPSENRQDRILDGPLETAPDDQAQEEISPEAPDRQTVPVAPDVIYADIDLSELSETTIDFLNDTAALYDSPSIGVAWQRYVALAGKYPESAIDVVFADLIDRRNEKVLDAFDRSDDTYDAIVIPWGAMHMPGIEQGMVSRGYSFESERYLPLIRYDTLMDRLRERRSFGSEKKAQG